MVRDCWLGEANRLREVANTRLAAGVRGDDGHEAQTGGVRKGAQARGKGVGNALCHARWRGALHRQQREIDPCHRVIIA